MRIAAVPPAAEGLVAIPAEPGLGVDRAPDAAGRRPPLQRPLAMRPHRDGLVVER